MTPGISGIDDETAKVGGGGVGAESFTMESPAKMGLGGAATDACDSSDLTALPATSASPSNSDGLAVATGEGGGLLGGGGDSRPEGSGGPGDSTMPSNNDTGDAMGVGAALTGVETVAAPLKRAPGVGDARCGVTAAADAGVKAGRGGPGENCRRDDIAVSVSTQSSFSASKCLRAKGSARPQTSAAQLCRKPTQTYCCHKNCSSAVVTRSSAAWARLIAALSSETAACCDAGLSPVDANSARSRLASLNSDCSSSSEGEAAAVLFARGGGAAA